MGRRQNDAAAIDVEDAVLRRCAAGWPNPTLLGCGTLGLPSLLPLPSKKAYRELCQYARLTIVRKAHIRCGDPYSDIAPGKQFRRALDNYVPSDCVNQRLMRIVGI